MVKKTLNVDEDQLLFQFTIALNNYYDLLDELTKNAKMMNDLLMKINETRNDSVSTTGGNHNQVFSLFESVKGEFDICQFV